MSDKEIINYAANQGGIIITMDKDFGELIYQSSMQHKGVLLLRLEDATASDKVSVLKQILKDHSDQLYQFFAVY